MTLQLPEHKSLATESRSVNTMMGKKTEYTQIIAERYPQLPLHNVILHGVKDGDGEAFKAGIAAYI